MGRPVLFFASAVMVGLLALVFVGPYARAHEHDNPAPAFTDLWPTETPSAYPTPTPAPDEPVSLPTGVLVGAAGVIVLAAGGVLIAPRVRRWMAPTVVYMVYMDHVPPPRPPRTPPPGPERPWVCTLWLVDNHTGDRNRLQQGTVWHPGDRAAVIAHVEHRAAEILAPPPGKHYECLATPSMVDA